MESGRLRRAADVRMLIAVVLILILGLAFLWLSRPPPTPPGPPNIIRRSTSLGRGPYSAVVDEIVVLGASAPQYRLPLSLNEVENLEDVDRFFHLSDEALSLLRKNGFVVVYFDEVDSFADAYERLRLAGIPIFVTADSMLHIYHVFFDEFLARLEEERFRGNLSRMVEGMVDASLRQYGEAAGDVREAALRNVAYFSVAARLLNPNFTIPDPAVELVDAELKLIKEHGGMYESPIFGYVEDYTQYIPRGHYTRSDELRAYFLAMMWLGRMRFQAKSTLQTLQALLLVSALREDAWMMRIWEEIYLTTAFLVGYCDDLTVYDYQTVMDEVYGGTPSLDELADAEKLAVVQEKLFELNDAKIISSPIYPWQKEELVGLRFMGQRFTPDSYILQELVFDRVEGRLLPKGLDVMAVLGSRRAEVHLAEDKAEYLGYAEQLEKLKGEFSAYSVENWTQNIYWSWLYTLKPLLEEPPSGVPTFMQTDAWLDEKLNTALGSWAELRHDTILYAKQSYTVIGIVPTKPPGYVEPNPQFYSRLAGLCDATMNGLRALGLLDPFFEGKLSNLRELLLKLAEISVKELSGEPLTEEERSLIQGMGAAYEGLLHGISERGWRSTIVADVHTDPNTGRVLEVGCGYLDFAIIVYKSPEGRLIAAAGPTFSYYEFPWPMEQRLTDEGWIGILEGGEAPQRPEWISSFHE